MDETLLAIAQACAQHRAGIKTETAEWVRGATAILATVLSLDPEELTARIGHEKHYG